MARSYSARLRRWKVRAPGLGFLAAAASMVSSIEVTKAVTSSSGGRLTPGGGIIPALSLRIIFSATGAFAVGFAGSNSSRVRLPRNRRSLWQRTQYCCTRSSLAALDTGTTAPWTAPKGRSESGGD